MEYKRGNAKIAIEKIEGFGKRTGLWIGTDNPNCFVKVASFGSEEKAELFANWMDYISGVTDDESRIKYEQRPACCDL